MAELETVEIKKPNGEVKTILKETYVKLNNKRLLNGAVLVVNDKKEKKKLDDALDAQA